MQFKVTLIYFSLGYIPTTLREVMVIFISKTGRCSKDESKSYYLTSYSSRQWKKYLINYKG